MAHVETIFADTPEGTRRIMRAIRSQSGLERLVRSMLHKSGYRFRKNVRSLPGRPDVVFSKRKKVVLVHGCFWHHHPGCNLAKRPRTRPKYWLPKLQRVVDRDREQERQLANLGWLVEKVWECEFRRDAPRVLEHLRRFLGPPSSMGR